MRVGCAVAPSALCILLVSTLTAQVTTPQQHLLRDWSTRHIVFTGLTPETLSDAVRADPRAWHSWVEHARYRFEPPRKDGRDARSHHHRRRRHAQRLATDWSMAIGEQVGPWASPAKFGFDVNAIPDCTNDYVVFPTATPVISGESNGPASLVAFNNLYTGPGPTGICPTPIAPASQPSVLFAYNTGSAPNGGLSFANLSPVLSLDGKKIAFVEDNTGAGGNYTAFHVLTWKAGEGTVDSAALPGDCSPGNSCMTTLVLSNTRSDSLSNPFVDYAHDIAYVGDDGGLLHKITPVFAGTPQEVVGNSWPLQLGSGALESPVYDSVSVHIFVTEAASNNTLYVIDAASGTIVKADPLSAITLSDPIVDSTNQTVFVFFADSNLRLSVAQFDTSGTLLSRIATGTLGGSASTFTGAFDNNYFVEPASGALYFAGAVNAFASLCSVGFTGKTMNASFSGPLVLTNSPFTSVPTPLTEIFNPTFSTAPDRIFLGIDANCSNPGPSVDGDGCIESLDISDGFPSGILASRVLPTGGSALSVSGIIVDNVSSSAQASSIYFEFVPPGDAVKLTQSDLQ